MNKSIPQHIGVVITTYNSPVWLKKVLIGYECQLDSEFTVLIADDGSNKATADLIKEFQNRKRLKIVHYWQEDEGFRKTQILNQVIQQTECDYLIFTDGDCIPRNDFIGTHRSNAEMGMFLSGGYIKLSMSVSELLDEQLIKSQVMFDKRQLLKLGQPRSLKLMKLVKKRWLANLLNRLTPTKATWNGMNSSGWLDDLKSVNGFDERLKYGGLDRELGERLWNKGIKSKQIRYSAICVHLDHPRGYSDPEIWKENYRIRDEVKKNKLTWTHYGITKTE